MRNYYLILTPYFPSDENFVGPFIYDQVKALEANSQFDIIVIKTGVSVSSNSYLYQGQIVHVFSLLDFPTFILPGFFHWLNVYRILKRLNVITKGHCERIKFIHGHVTYPNGILAVDIAKRIKAKSIVQHHGLDVMGYTNGRINNKLFRYINNLWINKIHLPKLNVANWNIGVSEKTLKELKQIKGYKPTNEYILYNGVNNSKFFRLPNERSNKFFVIGCIGNFWALKDQITLIKALNLLVNEGVKNINIKFIGQGPTLNDCKKYVEENNLENSIEFMAPIDHTKLNNFYNSLDLFILPSFWEALGCVYLEAYSIGVPFIGVEGMGISELVEPRNAQNHLIPKGDFERLAQLIKYWMMNRDNLEKLKMDVEINSLVKPFLTKILI